MREDGFAVPSVSTQKQKHGVKGSAYKQPTHQKENNMTTTTENAYGVNWSNIDLDSHEAEYSIIDDYTFADLLLEVNCNLRTINELTIMRQFEEALQNRITSAREVMRENLANITRHAQAYRNQE